MRHLFKLLVIPIAMLATSTLSSCAIEPKEIALITDYGDINDGSFNQESWEACKEYGDKFHKTYDFYRPFNTSDFARICAVKQAIAKGAKVIILPGYMFATTAYSVQNRFPDVHFLLIDSYVHNGNYAPVAPNDNVCCVGYLCEYSGYLAGYSIAIDLMMRDLNETNKLRDTYGFGYEGGMPNDGVYQFGFGFIQGIVKAASFITNSLKILSDNVPQINVNYNYAGVFAQDDNATARVKGWYESERDIKVVFACGGKLYQSVTEACQYYNKRHNLLDNWESGSKSPREAARWVGVDSDQYNGLENEVDMKAIYTSALKGLKNTVYDALNFHYNNNWAAIGGPTHHNSAFDKATYKWTLGLQEKFGDDATEAHDYVGIPNVTDEDGVTMRCFNNFNKEEYELLCESLTATGTLIYSGNSTEWDGRNDDKNIGQPDNMVNWVKTNEKGEVIESFSEKYLSNYNKKKIDIKVI